MKNSWLGKKLRLPSYGPKDYFIPARISKKENRVYGTIYVASKVIGNNNTLSYFTYYDLDYEFTLAIEMEAMEEIDKILGDDT
jgi:hypothetical protein